MAVNPLVGPDRFTIQKVQQDRPGMVLVIVTRPNNQQAAQVRHCGNLECSVLVSWSAKLTAVCVISFEFEDKVHCKEHAWAACL
jgi:hypothetical protein